jgi:hypothetical protein
MGFHHDLRADPAPFNPWLKTNFRAPPRNLGIVEPGVSRYDPRQ